MAVNLTEGGRVNLSKDNPGVTKIIVGLGYDNRATDGADFDLDASVFLLDDRGKAVAGDDSLIFYNNLKGLGGAVEHMGDNRTGEGEGEGEGEGDDEVIQIDLPAAVATNSSVKKFALIVTIHEAGAHNQHFGQVENACIRIVNSSTGTEIVRYDLTEDYSVETALIFGEVYVKDGEWRGGAVGQGFADGLEAALTKIRIGLIASASNQLFCRLCLR